MSYHGDLALKTFLAVCTFSAYNGVFKFKAWKVIAKTIRSIFKYFQRAGSAPTCDTIRAENGFPSRGGQETNLANGSIGRKEELQMKNAKIRDRIKHFLKSEAGRVGLKTPLALGIASGSLLVAQAMFSPSSHAGHECYSHSHCDPGEVCKYTCNGMMINDTCHGTWVRKCVSS